MKKHSIALILAGLIAPLSADQQILDDLIVTGSECIGFDCVNGESFGFDTLRLKENNLRIHFNDTSNSASFPSNDWRIVINDTANGGANYFRIEDSSNNKNPFTVEAGAPSHSLYVEDSGQVGFGTSTPVTDLHVVSGNTPTLRLQQDGSSGFAAQTWDVASNEANFFIRDVTNGSALSFRIRPGAPQSSLDIASDGDIGVGTDSPDADLHVVGSTLISDSDYGAATYAPLHVKRSDGTTKLVLEEASTTNLARILAELTNNGDPYINLENTAGTYIWMLGTNTDDFVITTWGNGANKQFRFAQNGDLTISGSLNPSSDRNVKENIEEVSVDSILNRIETLPLYKWNYIASENDTKHFGAMAQDFYHNFQIGIDDKHISPNDAAFIAIAGVQALKKELDQKEKEIKRLNKVIANYESLQLKMINMEMKMDMLSNSTNRKHSALLQQ